MRIRALKSLPDLGHENSDLTFGDRNALLVALDAFQGDRGEDDEDFPSGLLNVFGESLRPLRTKVRSNVLSRCKRPHDSR